ncbi:MAG: FeoC-like transcriptional regulator [Chloroflexota bacterium]
MLTQVLNEITHAREPITLTVLSRKLGIEPGALEGMLAHWVRKGRLKEDDIYPEAAHSAGSCGPSCGGAETCSFVAKMPRSYSLPVKVNDDELVS